MIGLWRLLEIDRMAIDAGYGLEYYLKNDLDKAKSLLRKGIQFCEMIEKGIATLTKGIYNQSDLEAWHDIQVLAKNKNDDELMIIKEKTDLVKKDLIRIVKENIHYSEDRIKDMQIFFSDISDPYISRAYKLTRRIELWH